MSNLNQEQLRQQQIETLKQTHLFELTNRIVKDDTYGKYLIDNPILHPKVLDLIKYGIKYFSEIEDYEECALLVTLKKQILNKK